MAFPLDRDQLAQRLAARVDELPIRLAFKAVDVRSGNMVGYAELGGIDRNRRRADIELPLVAPEAADRELLGVLLLRALADHAFRKLGFLRLQIRLHSRSEVLEKCCHRAWNGRYSYRIYGDYNYRVDADKQGPRVGCIGWVAPWR